MKGAIIKYKTILLFALTSLNVESSQTVSNDQIQRIMPQMIKVSEYTQKYHDECIKKNKMYMCEIANRESKKYLKLFETYKINNADFITQKKILLNIVESSESYINFKKNKEGKDE